MMTRDCSMQHTGARGGQTPPSGIHELGLGAIAGALWGPRPRGGVGDTPCGPEFQHCSARTSTCHVSAAGCEMFAKTVHGPCTDGAVTTVVVGCDVA